MAIAAGVGLGLGVVGSFLGAKGEKEAGRAKQAQLNYQAQVARNNATLARRASKDAIERGDIAAGQKGTETRQAIGRVRVSAASRGVKVGSGSARDLSLDTQRRGRQDIVTILRNSEREANARTAQAGQFEAEANLLVAGGKSARRAGDTNFFTTLLTGASSTALSVANFRAIGVF